MSVNDKVYFDKPVEENRPGKVGIYIAHGVARGKNKAVNINIKNFKVWKL